MIFARALCAEVRSELPRALQSKWAPNSKRRAPKSAANGATQRVMLARQRFQKSEVAESHTPQPLRRETDPRDSAQLAQRVRATRHPKSAASSRQKAQSPRVHQRRSIRGDHREEATTNHQALRRWVSIRRSSNRDRDRSRIPSAAQHRSVSEVEDLRRSLIDSRLDWVRRPAR